MYSITQDGAAAMENGRREDQVARSSQHEDGNAELDEVSTQLPPPCVVETLWTAVGLTCSGKSACSFFEAAPCQSHERFEPSLGSDVAAPVAHAGHTVCAMLTAGGLPCRRVTISRS
jgi:hypothetical protein